ELAGVLAALSDTLALEAEPGAAFLDHVLFHAQIEQVAFHGDAFAVHDVELGFPERRGHLVLHHFGPGAVADYHITVLQRGDPADVDAHGGVKLQRAAPRGGLGIAEHHADFFANLINKYQAGVRF